MTQTDLPETPESLGPWPRATPNEYPGAIPDFSYLLWASRCLKITPPEGSVSGRTVSRWTVDRSPQAFGQNGWRPDRGEVLRFPGEPVGQEVVKSPSVAYSLTHLGATPMTSRFPVLAVGSNAAPRQLSEKFARRDSVVIVTRCIVCNLTLSYAPFTAWGYLPLAARADHGSETTLFVCWLDHDQLRAITSDELGNGITGYRLWKLERNDFPVTLDKSGEVLECVFFYRPIGRQVMPSAAIGEKVPIQLASARQVQALHRRIFETVGIAPVDDGFDGKAVEETQLLGSLDQPSASIAMYRNQRSLWTEDGEPILSATARNLQEKFGTALLVHPTGITTRTGEYVVKVSPSVEQSLRSERSRHSRLVTHVVVSASDRDLTPRSVVAKLQVCPRARSDGSDEMEVEIDETLRCAIGVDVNEHVRLAAVEVERQIIANWLYGQRRYLMARVARGEFGFGESDLCGLPRMVLDALGVRSGDDVVIEGLARKRGKVRHIILRAVEMPSEVESHRRLLTAGGKSAWFPSAEEVLGVGIDLPEIALDDDARRFLGVQLLDPVRVGTHRWSQVIMELREAIYLVGLSAFVAIAMIYDVFVHRGMDWGVALLLLVPVAIMTGVVRHRLRCRFRARSTLVPGESRWHRSRSGGTMAGPQTSDGPKAVPLPGTQDVNQS